MAQDAMNKSRNTRGFSPIRVVGKRRARQLRSRGELVVAAPWLGPAWYVWGLGVVQQWNSQIEKPKAERRQYYIRPRVLVVPMKRHPSTDRLSRARVSSPF